LLNWVVGSANSERERAIDAIAAVERYKNLLRLNDDMVITDIIHRCSQSRKRRRFVEWFER
jgi:hypothetical protein